MAEVNAAWLSLALRRLSGPGGAVSQFSSIDNRVRLDDRPILSEIVRDADSGGALTGTLDQSSFPISQSLLAPAAPAPLIDVADLDGTNGFMFIGADRFDVVGANSTGGGDLNGDGYADLLVTGFKDNDTSRPNIHVIYGHAGPVEAVWSTAELDGANGYTIDFAGRADASPQKLVSIGDFNGDGRPDIAVGAPATDVGGRSYAGVSYVLFGRAGQIDSLSSPADLDPTEGFRILGPTTNAILGQSLSLAGDINGDGFADLTIAAPGATAAMGKVYVIFGSATPPAAGFELSDLNGANGFTIESVSDAGLARRVADAGDVNGDGYDDLIIGGVSSIHFSGAASVVYGRADGFPAHLDLSSVNGTDGFQMRAGSEYVGKSVAGAGDVNGDGFADLLVGSRSYGSNGRTYVVFGSADGPGANLDLAALDGLDGFRITGSNFGPQLAIGDFVSSAGDINGDGFADIILGAEGYTQRAVVIYGHAGPFDPTLDLHNLTSDQGFVIVGPNANTATLHTASSAGDLNGDGLDDIVVGGRSGTSSVEFNGAAYVIYGELPDEAVNRIGTVASQHLVGGDFDDTLSGLGGNDQLFGNGGADTLLGGLGDDTVRAGAGNDSVDGGEGQDTIVLSGDLDDYVINALGGGLGRFIDQRGGAPDGLDMIAGMESFVFADVTLTAAQLFRALPVTGGVANHGLAEAGLGGAGVATASTSPLGVSGAIGAVVFDVAGWTQTGPSTYSHAGVYGTAVLDISMGAVSYTLDNQDADTQALGQGQAVADSFTVALYDQKAGRGSMAVAFNITGGNDAPTITGGGQVSTHLVEAGVNNSGTSTVWATAILFHDPDAADAPGFSTDGWQRVGTTSSYTRAGAYGTATLNVTTGVVSYMLDNADNDTQALRAGETATDSLLMTVLDGHGGSAATTVVFTIEGANDAPIITGGQVSTTLVEAGLDGPGTSAASATAILFHDPDTGDAPGFSTDGWTRVGTTDAYTRAGVYGTATLNVVTGVVSYELNNADRDTQALDQGDTATDSFLMSVSDGHGGLASTTVSFTIHGAYDSPVGTRGDDVLAGDAHDDLIDGGKGDDAIDGGGGDDTLLGGAGKDSLAGGFGADLLSGAAGVDSLNGAAGADQLTGGLGADVLTGGAGKDIFVFESVKDSSKKAADLITDLGKTDVIDVSAIDADSKTAGNQAFHLVSAFSHSAGELVVSYDADKDQTLVLGDVNGDGKADLVISIAGDAHSFHHFVL